MLCSRILITTLTARVAPLQFTSYLEWGVYGTRETYAESPVKITFNFCPDIPMAEPTESISKRYISKASSIAKGYGSEGIRQIEENVCITK